MVVLPQPPFAANTVTTFPSGAASAPATVAPAIRCERLERAPARLAQSRQVVRGEHLAHSGPQRLTQHRDVDPAPHEHHADLRPLDLEGGGELEGEREIGAGADDDEQLVGPLVEVPVRTGGSLDHAHVAADGERVRLGELGVRLDQQRHGASTPNRRRSFVPLPTTTSMSPLRSAK